MPDLPLVSFMIATRNRVSELVKTLHSCLAQSWPAKEILVVDDASADDTAATVRALFPQVNLVRWEHNRGSIAARNDILRRARGQYILGLDDDSRFIDATACEQVVKRLEAEPDLGILSFQAIGPEHPERLTEAGRLRGEWHVSSFAACGVALRRSLLEKTGYLEPLFYHMYEEPDLCLRAWDAGYRVLQWNDIVVFHEFSAQNRNVQANHRRQARNEALSTWLRCPWHLVVPLTLLRFASQARYAATRGWLWREPRVWAEFVCLLPRALLGRRPVGTRALKICLAVNRERVSNPKLVWSLGELAWSSVLRGCPR